MSHTKGTIPVTTGVSSARRYTLGVVGVALLGGVVLAAYVVWSSIAISGALEKSLEGLARDAAVSYRDKLSRALVGWDATSADAWSKLDPSLEEAFETLPNLIGIVIRLPSGKIGAVIGPNELRSRDFVAAPRERGGMSVRIDGSGGEQPRANVSFLLGGEAGRQGVEANVHLRFPSLGLGHSIIGLFRIGTVIVVVLIYLLAALAFFIGRHGERAVNREREKAVRLKAIGDVAGAIAHELRNPLNAISLSFQVIGETLRRPGAADASRARDLDRAQGEVAKISKVVDNFVSFARLSDMNVTEFDLADVARDALAGLSGPLAEASVRPGLQVTGATRMRGDRDKIREAAVTTLQAVLDAVKARPGSLDVEVAGAPRQIALTIRGSGERVDSRRITNFTAARRVWDEPVGLGLTIARTWIDLHGGSVSSSEPSGDRTEVSIVLPKGFGG
jgi:signal transduction histidine kinase